MQKKILLNKNKGKKSVNETNVIPIEMNRDISLFYDEIKADTIDTINVYNNEKDKSTKHRFIFTINPFCSNSVFNYLTEIVYKEGSGDCVNFPNTGNAIEKNKYTSISNINRNRVNAIRNTEYSNDKFNCIYHCGLDIFNNHLFRAKEDISVQKRSNNSNKICKVYDNNLNTYLQEIDSFNTLGDYVRNHYGNDVKINAPIPNDNFLYRDKWYNEKSLPLYMYDTVKTFEESYHDNIERKDGWIGFKNPITLNVPVSTSSDYYVNKVLNNKEGGEFIDLCPERDLFYFTPKKNNYRNRLENNWHYCLTYPVESIYEGHNILTGKGKGLPLFRFDNNSYYIEYLSGSGLDVLTLRSVVKHNLNIGDYVNIIFSNNEKIKCRVINVNGLTKESKDRYFSILKSDIEPYISDGSYPVRFLKVVQGYECEYYFRKFRKIKINDDDLKSTINKVAFANTVYGDEVSQIMYTDTFDCNEYEDNRGRPLTEIYLTILKSNRGHNKWYNKNSGNINYSDETIEYSHVFGKVSSGLDLPPYTITNTNLPIIRRYHNIDVSSINSGNDTIYIPNSSKCIENDITISNNDFIGDLVEFNPITQDEIVLEKVMHRFNTAQREITGQELYKNLYYDEMGMDLYDNDNNNGLTSIIRKIKNSGYANLNPEGYIYQPHYKIQIGKFKDTINEGFNILMEVNNIDKYITNINNIIITFDTNIFYSLIVGDKITLIDKTTYKKYEFIVTYYKYNNEKNIYECKMEGNTRIGVLSNYLFFKHNNDIPEYAYLLPDDSGKCLWRDILPPSEYTFMDELYKTPFTNDAFYHHTNINFYVKRQYPFQKYELFIKDNDGKSVELYRTPVSEIDLSDDDFITESNNSTCF